QIFFGLIFCVFLVFGLSRGTDVIVPFTGQVLNLAYWYFPFIIFVFMATTNSVNLTDGLDGLAAGSTFIVALGLVLICFITGHYSLAAFSASLAGGCLGFLIYNRHPARIFMGDTGSMALGGAVAAVAALTGTELALVFIGGIYVLEAISDIIQVTSFKMTGRRVFLMAPLHHHFELKGWAEKKVVAFFWFLTLIFVILGIWGLRTPGL
ncbi:MAG: phospho-N-acetylmuramoyl-pentapeptide-transferase, partial [Syntrophomonadaceae bacterium]|nr:phospho-N-acetylmuramoyl-pentapeptide-transferase [Syntrophomonadaceae bacterium]